MTVLDWRSHRIGRQARPCRHCQRPAWCRDAAGRAAHKVCAEEKAHEQTAAVAAAYARNSEVMS